MTAADGANGPAAECPNRELDDLITRHLDGGLDTAGQRRLAEMLAASPAARRTLAGYLRLDGATFRLAAAGQLGPASHQGREPSRPWRLGPARLAIAAGLLAASIVVLVISGGPRPAARRGDDVDLLAAEWMELQRIHERTEVGTVTMESALDASADPPSDADDPATDAISPPGWLVAALLAEGATPDAPDES